VQYKMNDNAGQCLNNILDELLLVHEYVLGTV